MSCVIAAPCSGSGKTLLSLCLAAAVRRRDETLQTFKVGPDYLDPQLLTEVSGRPCRNLDPLLCGEEWVTRLFHWHGQRTRRVLVEGVMGLFDGRGPGSEGSTAHVAALLDLPVVLVIEASRQAGSLAAVVRGFRDHGPPKVRLAGVVLNRVGSERHRALLAEALAAIGIPLLGTLPHHPALALPSRHLGLLPPRDLGHLGERVGIWAALASDHLDLERFWPLLQPPPAPQIGGEDPIRWRLGGPGGGSPGPALGNPGRQSDGSARTQPAGAGHSVVLPVAVASDAAFHFRYPEAQELLAAVGLEAVEWSPMADEALPRGCRGVVLPGGYPELHAATLAGSHRALAQLVDAAARGIPIVAECGGMLLLGESLEDGEGRMHPMAGVLPFSARPGSLSLGYRQATPAGDGLLVRRGEVVTGHEFHRWQIQPCGKKVSFRFPTRSPQALWQLEGWGSPPRVEGWSSPRLHASWLHLHWAGVPRIPWRLAFAAASAAPVLPGTGCDRLA